MDVRTKDLYGIPIPEHAALWDRLRDFAVELAMESYARVQADAVVAVLLQVRQSSRQHLGFDLLQLRPTVGRAGPGGPGFGHGRALPQLCADRADQLASCVVGEQPLLRQFGMVEGQLALLPPACSRGPTGSCSSGYIGPV